VRRRTWKNTKVGQLLGYGYNYIIIFCESSAAFGVMLGVSKRGSVFVGVCVCVQLGGQDIGFQFFFDFHRDLN